MDQVEKGEGQQDRQEVMDQNLTKLVGNLLGMEPAKEQHNAVFQKCLRCARRELQKDQQYPESDEECVTRNLNHFLARYNSEHLHEFGATFDKLANMMLKHPMFVDDGEMNFKWRILDFMLSVNFEAFRNVKRNPSEMEQQRKCILAKIDEIITSSLSEGTESSDSFGEGDIVEKFPISPRCLLSDSNDSTQESSSSVSSLNVEINKLPEDMSECPHQIVVSMDFHFCNEYADYLESHPCQTDCRLLYEYISMFFSSQDWIHFQEIDELHFCKLQCLIPQINLMQPLKDMNMLQKLIKKYACPWRITANSFSTSISLFEGMHRLLKPVMEFLIYWAERVNKEDNEASQSISQGFFDMALEPFRKLHLMGELCRDSYIPDTEFTTEHERSFHIIATLLSTTKQCPFHSIKTSSAALLLSSLRSYCQFMANMYRLGEFGDHLGEFIAELVKIDGISDYKMRSMKEMVDIVENCELYQILEKHIQNSSKAVSFLYDNRRIDLFSVIHKHVIKSSLYIKVIESFLYELKTYQMLTVDDKMFPTPDILTQAQLLDDGPLRRLLYTYYKQLEGDSNIRVRDFKCDEILSACKSCCMYVPFTEILLNAMDHALTQRTLLVNTYAVHVLSKELDLEKHMRHLRSVYLLFEYDRFSNEFGEFFDSVAVEHLSQIVSCHNQDLAHFFIPVLPCRDIAFLELQYKCDEAAFMNRIITKQQLYKLNAFFCLNLQIYQCKWKLEKLFPLGKQSEICLHKTFTELYDLTIQILNEYAEYLTRLRQKHLKLARNCDQQMAKCQTIEEMAKCHDDFVTGVTDNLIMNYPDRCDLQTIFRLVDVLKGLWSNVRWLYTDVFRKANIKIPSDEHDYESITYIQTLLPLAVAIHSSLAKLKSENK
ncbi:uncharacterized protein t-Grip128 [Drosophila tropicalis]|uniref:uncharacterized protein t-Grip128 n=1 Tax=Drosophila tropicalis TaxID=46794 RepID=UPI0035ABD016